MRQEIAINLGWGHPFGNSVEYGVDLADGNVLGVGAGLSMAGGMYGIDARRFFRTERAINPYLGLAVSKATGVDEITVNSRSGSLKDTAVYQIEGGIQVVPRAGVRLRLARLHLYLNGGYGIVVSGGGMKWVSGTDNSSTRRIVELFTLGGVEASISGGFVF